MNVTKFAVIALAAVAFGGASVALAHEGATGVVKERMELMKSLGAATKELAAMMRGKRDYDADRVRELAERIAGHGGTAMTEKFPEGSLDKPSRATPEVWEDWDEFAELASELTLRAEALAQMASESGDTPPMSAFRDVVRNCSVCHKGFREEKQ